MEFSKEQKKFLDKFASLKSYEVNKSNTPKCDCNLIIRTLVKAEILEWDIKAKTLTIYSTEDKEANEVFEWIYFFELLKSEGYLYFLELPSKDSDAETCTKTIVRIFDRSRIWCDEDATKEEEKYFDITIDDDGEITSSSPLFFRTKNRKIYTQEVVTLNKFMKNTMHPTHKLRELVKHKFKTQEQREFDTQLKKTNWALYISIIALVASTIVGVVGLLRNSDVKADAQQYNELINAIQNTSIDTTRIEVSKPTPL